MQCSKEDDMQYILSVCFLTMYNCDIIAVEKTNNCTHKNTQKSTASHGSYIPGLVLQ